MSNFDLAKMAATVDNLGTSLDIMLCCKDVDGGEEILESCEQLESLVVSLDRQIQILKAALVKEKNARQSVRI